MLRILAVLTTILLLALGSTVLAQDDAAPPTIDFALNDLSQQVGTNVTLSDLTQWNYQGELWLDASLGCPQPGQSYAQVQTRGIQYLITYQGVTYDYRVSADGNIVVLCSAAGSPVDSPEAPETPDLTQPPGAVDPAPDTIYEEGACPTGLPIRLTEGGQATVQTDIVALNLRSAPTTAADVLARMPDGSVVTILNGPVCGPNGLNWWQVDYGATVGWAAEGADDVYYLDPLPGSQPPVEFTPQVTPPPSLTLIAPIAACETGIPPRLTAESVAQVVPDINAPLNIREAPTITSDVFAQIPRGAFVTVLGGPVCGPTGINWWQISYDDFTGWVAEGNNNAYLLQPADAD